MRPSQAPTSATAPRSGALALPDADSIAGSADAASIMASASTTASAAVVSALAGVGAGFGWGWGWGWGGWWNPWWWDPFWWGPPAAYYDPWWGWAPPAPAAVPGDYSLYYGNSNSTYNAPYDNPASGYGSTDSFSASLGSPNLNPLTDNVASTTPTILLYLKDGTMLAASDYWISDNKLHYLVNYGGESVVDMNQVDLQRTVDENGKRGVKFWLKPNPNRATESPSPSASPAPAPAPAPAAPVQTSAAQSTD